MAVVLKAGETICHTCCHISDGQGQLTISQGWSLTLLNRGSHTQLLDHQYHLPDVRGGVACLGFGLLFDLQTDEK